jgi:hypothetical protein
MPAPGGCWDSGAGTGCEEGWPGPGRSLDCGYQGDKGKDKKGICRRCAVVLALRFCGFATGVKGALAVGILSEAPTGRNGIVVRITGRRRPEQEP